VHLLDIGGHGGAHVQRVGHFGVASFCYPEREVFAAER